MSKLPPHLVRRYSNYLADPHIVCAKAPCNIAGELPPLPNESLDFEAPTSPGNPPATPIKINEDGSIEATSFIDTSQGGMRPREFKPTDGVDGFYFEKPIDTRCYVIYAAGNMEKTFESTISTSYSLVNQFAKIRGKVKRFSFENLDRFIHADRYLKAGIKKLLKLKNKFYFADKKFNTYINKPFVDSTTYGPYNYDTQIKVTEDLEFINDLLVIKTGNFHNVTLSDGVGSVPSGENICFVSPHDFLAYTGVSDYITTGVTVENAYYTGHAGTQLLDYSWTVKHDGLTNLVDTHSLTSKYITVPKDETLRTNIFYQKAQFDGTENKVTYTNQTLPSETDFNTFLTRENTGRHGRAHSVISGEWDGVIPAGAFIKIETWSTNPDYVGFDGELAIVPVNEELTCDFSATVEGKGIDKNYSSSILKAMKKSYKTVYRKLNKYLVEKGIKPKNSGQKSYEKMITKNAQNIYEGLLFIRNENLQKQRGVEFSPINSPYYFDGTHQIYGGVSLNSNYNHADIVTNLSNSLNSTVSPFTNGTSTEASTENIQY